MTMGEVSGASFDLGTAFRPETLGEGAVATMVRLLDLQDRAPSIERLRAWALAAGEVRAGETCLDVGSGTGTMTRRLAGIVGPEGRAVGIEPNGMLRQVAEARAAEDGTGATVEFCQGVATELPMPDDSVDVVWCERVLQHLPDAGAAVVEIARVLRPGGRALLLDSDHESRVEAGMDPDASHAITRAFLGQVANPTAARHVRRQALAAGLTVDPDVGSAAFVFAPDQLADSQLHRMSVDQAVLDGLLTRERADEALRSMRVAAEEGWAFAAVTIFGFVCRKPS